MEILFDCLNFVLIKVVARGIVVLSEQIPMSSEAPQTSATLTFTATNQMAPKSRLVIYAIRAKNKEVCEQIWNGKKENGDFILKLFRFYNFEQLK